MMPLRDQIAGSGVLRFEASMPSKSPAQARLMAAAAHTPGGYGGVPQSVGREFNQADKGSGIIKPKRSNKQRKLSKTFAKFRGSNGS